MNQPGPLSRLAGYPPFTLVMLGGVSLVGYEYYVGHMFLWEVFVSIGLGIGTLKAAARMSRYRQWSAEWQAMGGGSRSKASRLGWYVLGVALAVAIPLALPYIPNHPRVEDGLTLFWLALCGCAGAWVLLKFSKGSFSLVRGSVIRGNERKTTKALAAPVSWMRGRASSSPSRRDAMRRMPDYARKVLAK